MVFAARVERADGLARRLVVKRSSNDPAQRDEAAVKRTMAATPSLPYHEPLGPLHHPSIHSNRPGRHIAELVEATLRMIRCVLDPER
jgi:hypothetical protein